MNVSVIIPTYNGRHRLGNVLKSLERQTVKPFEVVLVIDGSTDGTDTFLEENRFALPNFRVNTQANSGRAMVRNNGAKLAGGDILLFIDDDMIAPPDWVKMHLEHHRAHPDSIMTGKLKDPEMRKSNDFLNFRSWLNVKWSKGLEEKQDEEFILDHPYITANNFSLPKRIFEQLDGFDKRLKDAEDYDLAVMAGKLDIPVYFSSKAFAYNNDIDNVTCVKYISRIREYTIAQKRLRQLKPDLYPENHQYAVIVPKGLKGAVFNFFCSRFWIDAVDKEWLKFLPERLRYRVYDVIITANASFFPDKVSI